MGHSLISSLSSMMSILSTTYTLLLLALSGASSTQSCMSDGSTPPDCSHDPEISLYQPHEYDCSLFWQCTPDGRACLRSVQPSLRSREEVVCPSTLRYLCVTGQRTWTAPQWNPLSQPQCA